MNIIHDKYKVLVLLSEYQANDGFSRISQQEISDKLNISRITINKYFKELIADEMIEIDEKYLSKYRLTNKAIKIVKKLRALED